MAATFSAYPAALIGAAALMALDSIRHFVLGFYVVGRWQRVQLRDATGGASELEPRGSLYRRIFEAPVRGAPAPLQKRYRDHARNALVEVGLFIVLCFLGVFTT